MGESDYGLRKQRCDVASSISLQYSFTGPGKIVVEDVRSRMLCCGCSDTRGVDGLRAVTSPTSFVDYGAGVEDAEVRRREYLNSFGYRSVCRDF